MLYSCAHGNSGRQFKGLIISTLLASTVLTQHQMTAESQTKAISFDCRSNMMSRLKIRFDFIVPFRHINYMNSRCKTNSYRIRFDTKCL